jgi:hypothetical protein
MNLCVTSYDGRLKDKYILGCPFMVETMGVYTLQWPHMDIIMAIFLIFLRCKKINITKFIEIIKNGFIYLKLS